MSATILTAEEINALAIFSTDSPGEKALRKLLAELSGRHTRITFQASIIATLRPVVERVAIEECFDTHWKAQGPCRKCPPCRARAAIAAVDLLAGVATDG